jgi:hypothetical protein
MDLNKEANAALEAATTRVNEGRYTGREQATMEVELMVRLASAHAQMAIARQAEIANLLKARKDFEDAPFAHAAITARLFALMGL